MMSMVLPVETAEPGLENAWPAASTPGCGRSARPWYHQTQGCPHSASVFEPAGCSDRLLTEIELVDEKDTQQ